MQINLAISIQIKRLILFFKQYSDINRLYSKETRLILNVE